MYNLKLLLYIIFYFLSLNSVLILPRAPSYYISVEDVLVRVGNAPVARIPENNETKLLAVLKEALSSRNIVHIIH